MTVGAGARLPVPVERSAILPTGTVTFLVTDVEGAIAGWGRAPEAMGAALVEHDAILDATIGRHDGIRLVEDGDSVVAVFTQPSDAVTAALDAQKRLQAEPWAGGLEFATRMAVHAGQVVLRGEGNYAGSTLDHGRRLWRSATGARCCCRLPRSS